MVWSSKGTEGVTVKCPFYPNHPHLPQSPDPPLRHACFISSLTYSSRDTLCISRQKMLMYYFPPCATQMVKYSTCSVIYFWNLESVNIILLLQLLTSHHVTSWRTSTTILVRLNKNTAYAKAGRNVGLLPRLKQQQENGLQIIEVMREEGWTKNLFTTTVSILNCASIKM